MRIARSYSLRVHLPGTLNPTAGTVDFTLADLAGVPSFGGQRIDARELRTSSYAWRFSVVDTAGVLTANLSDPTTGRMDLLGRVVEVIRDGSPAAVGRLADLAEAAPGTYNLTVQDERWAERRAVALDVANTCNVWPPAIRQPFMSQWGGTGGAGAWLRETDGNRHRLEMSSNWPMAPRIAEWIRGDRVREPDPERTDGAGNYEHLRMELDGTDYPILSFQPQLHARDLEPADFGSPPNPALGSTINVWIWAPTLPSPARGGTRYDAALWAPTAPPDDTLPVHVGGNFPGRTPITAWNYASPWDLVPAIYAAAGVRYDAAAFAALAADPSYPRQMGWRITEPVTDLAEWLDRNIYAPLQVAPFIDQEGRISPKSVRLPAAATFDYTTTFVFDGGNLVRPPTWDHPGQELANVLEVEVEHLRPAAWSSPPLDQINEGTRTTLLDQDYPADGLISEVRTVRREHDNVADLGQHPVNVNLRGLPIFGGRTLASNFGRVPQALEALDYLAAGYFERWGDGPILGTLLAVRGKEDATGRTPEDVEAGDLVRIAVATYPNAEIRARGGQRVVQVLSTRETAQGILLDVLDVGPALQPLPAPSLTLAVNAANPRHAVDHTLGLIPDGTTATIEFDYGNTGEWTRKVANRANGTRTTAGLPSGTLIRARAQIRRPGRTSSAWSTIRSVTTTALTPPGSLATSVQGYTVTLTWAGGTAGYRVVPVWRTNDAGDWNEAAPIPPGSTTNTFDLAGPSTLYGVGVKLVDPYGGESTVASTTATTATAPDALAAPDRLQIRQGRQPGTPPPTRPREVTLGPGLEVAFQPRDIHAEHAVQVSTDGAFANVDQELRVAPGRASAFIFTPLDNVARFIRVRAERDGWDPSPWSTTVSALPTLLLQDAVVDRFAGGFAYLRNASGVLEITAGSGGDTDTERVYYAAEVNPADPAVYPTVTTADPFLASPFPVTTTADDGAGGTIPLAAGDVVVATFRFWNSTSGFGQETRAALTVGGTTGPTDPADLAIFNVQMDVASVAVLGPREFHVRVDYQMSGFLSFVATVTGSTSGQVSGKTYNLTGTGTKLLEASGSAAVLVVPGTEEYTVLIQPWTGANATGTAGALQDFNPTAAGVLELRDVDLTGALAGGEVLRYNPVGGLWETDVLDVLDRSADETVTGRWSFPDLDVTGDEITVAGLLTPGVLAPTLTSSHLLVADPADDRVKILNAPTANGSDQYLRFNSSAGGFAWGLLPSGDAATLDGELPSFYLDRTNHTGTIAPGVIANTDGGPAAVGEIPRVSSMSPPRLEWISPSSLTITEGQIQDGTILARLAADETVTGRWSFPDLDVTGDEITVAGLLTPGVLAPTLTGSHLLVADPADDRLKILNAPAANGSDQYLRFNSSAGGFAWGLLPSGDAATLGGELPAYYLDRTNHTGTIAPAVIANTDGGPAAVGEIPRVSSMSPPRLEWIPPSSLTITEGQIQNGTILARLAADETITGRWSFPDLDVTGDEITVAGLLTPGVLAPTLTSSHLLVADPADDRVKILNAPTANGSDQYLRFNSSAGGFAWGSMPAGDADTLDGQNGTYYLDRSNHTGTIAPGVIANTDGGPAAVGEIPRVSSMSPVRLEWIPTSSLTITEGQIQNGTILARLAADESVTGTWNFQDVTLSGDVVKLTGVLWPGVFAPTNTGTHLLVGDRNDNRLKILNAPAANGSDQYLRFNSSAGGFAWGSMPAGDADTLDGQNGTYYLARSNHTGSIAPGVIDNTDGGPSATGQVARISSMSPPRVEWVDESSIGGFTGYPEVNDHIFTLADGTEIARFYSSSGYLKLSGANPSLFLYDADESGFNEKYARFYHAGGSLRIASLTDAGSTADTLLLAVRNGVAWSYLQIAAPLRGSAAAGLVVDDDMEVSGRILDENGREWTPTIWTTGSLPTTGVSEGTLGVIY